MTTRCAIDTNNLNVLEKSVGMVVLFSVCVLLEILTTFSCQMRCAKEYHTADRILLGKKSSN
jgi:hypothetical protein